MNKDAIDFIDKLLVLDPLKRLGYGQKGSDTDFESMKKHPFFAGLNFDRVASKMIAPPIPKKLFQ